MIDNNLQTHAAIAMRGPAADRQAERQLSALSSLLEDAARLEPAEADGPLHGGPADSGRVVRAPWGMARGLFLALRAKHPPTAAHGLRVALTCSSWAAFLDVENTRRDELELAALLHEVGKIGVPDQVLNKTGKLSPSEVAVMERHRRIGRELLSACSAPAGLQHILWYAPAWFDARGKEFDRWGEQLPRAARMLAIADTYDSLRARQVDRPSEAALAELTAAAGTQFDPALVQEFSRFLAQEDRLVCLPGALWLYELQQRAEGDVWTPPAGPPEVPTAIGPFHEQLLENMHDGVVFFDADLRIRRWNRALEALTGIAAIRAEDQPWDPAILQMRDEHYKLISPQDCPVLQAVRSGAIAHRRLYIADAKQHKISVDAHIAPVVDASGQIYGATLLLQDASSRVSLEERVQTLHEKVRQDGLTRVANRAELDRVHEEWVQLHLNKSVPYSMIICDLDHFKKVNDTYGHQAGDDALVTFATLLKKFCRSTDLVARYGGEEFVVLCPGCDSPTASLRAEAIREAIAAAPQPMLDGKCITASFGVTELQPGDTPETILRRADRALLQAKNDGRNAVVQMAAGMDDQPPLRFGYRRWLTWLHRRPGQLLLSRKVITAVPLNLTVEKLRGFVADNDAEVVEIAESRVVLKFHVPGDLSSSRRTRSPMTFLMDLELREICWDASEDAGSQRTVVHVTIRPKRQRDRPRRDADERARRLLARLKSYLMAQDYDRLGK